MAKPKTDFMTFYNKFFKPKKKPGFHFNLVIKGLDEFNRTIEKARKSIAKFGRMLCPSCENISKSYFTMCPHCAGPKIYRLIKIKKETNENP